MRFPWSKKHRRSKEPVDIKALSKQIIARRMKRDPEFAEQVAMRELRYAEVEPEEYGEPGEHRPFKEYMADVREMKAFMEEFKSEAVGGGKFATLLQGMGEGLGNSLGQALAPLAEQLAKKTMAQGQQRTVILAIDGQPTEVTESQYHQLQQEGKLKPIAAIEAPKEEIPPREITPTPEPEVEPVPEPTPEPVTEETPVRLVELTQFLDLEPEKAVEVLRREYPQWVTVLSLQDYDGILATISPFGQDNPEIQEAIDKLLTDEGKEWLTTVINLAKAE